MCIVQFQGAKVHCSPNIKRCYPPPPPNSIHPSQNGLVLAVPFLSTSRFNLTPVHHCLLHTLPPFSLFLSPTRTPPPLVHCRLQLGRLHILQRAMLNPVGLGTFHPKSPPYPNFWYFLFFIFSSLAVYLRYSAPFCLFLISQFSSLAFFFWSHDFLHFCPASPIAVDYTIIVVNHQRGSHTTVNHQILLNLKVGSLKPPGKAHRDRRGGAWPGLASCSVAFWPKTWNPSAPCPTSHFLSISLVPFFSVDHDLEHERFIAPPPPGHPFPPPARDRISSTKYSDGKEKKPEKLFASKEIDFLLAKPCLTTTKALCTFVRMLFPGAVLPPPPPLASNHLYLHFSSLSLPPAPYRVR